MMGMNVINYGFNIALGRLTSPAEYGTFVAFTSIFLLFGLFPGTLQAVHARYVALGQSDHSRLSRYGLGLGVVLGLLLLLSSSVFARVFGMPVGWFWALGVGLPLVFHLGTLRGWAQGNGHFLDLAVNLNAEHGLKVLLTAVFWMFWPTVNSAVFASLMVFPFLVVHLRNRDSKRPVGPIQKGFGPFALSTFLSLVSQAVVVNLDILVVKLFFSSENVGLYAALSMVGKVVFYVAWAVASSFYATVAKSGHLGDLRLLWKALLWVGALVACATLGSFVLGPWVVGLLFGSAYLGAAPLLWVFSLSMGLYALQCTLNNHFLALGVSSAGYLSFLTAVVQMAALLAFHSSLTEVIWAILLARFAILVFNGLALWWIRRIHVVPAF